MTKEATAANETIVKLKNVRIAFPQLFEPKAVNGEGTPAYSASFILDKTQNADAIKEIEKATLVVAKTKWKDKADAVMKKLKLADKLPLHDGDLKAEYDGYEGNLFVSARGKVKPRVVNRSNEELLPADGIPYSGSYVNGSVAIWAQDNNYGQRINATLRGVQFVKDGEAFSGGRPAGDDEFDSVDGDEDLA